MRMVSNWIALGFFCLVVGGCGKTEESVCPDDGDPSGAVCITGFDADTEFDAVSSIHAETFSPYGERITKYMAPVDDRPDLLPPLLQNINRYDVHLIFLKAVFPDRFGSLDQQSYLELVTARATRQYYSGNFVRFDHPEKGVFYGFTVYTAASSDEQLEVEEVRALYQQLSSAFTTMPIQYTFEKWDAMARQKAETWIEPGFPIYFLD